MVQIPHNLNSFLIGIIISPPGACSPIGAKADAFLKKTNSGNTILILKQSFPSGPTAPRGKGKNFDFLFICFPVPAACGCGHRPSFLGRLSGPRKKLKNKFFFVPLPGCYYFYYLCPQPEASDPGKGYKK